MIIGIAKLLILFPFIPYLIFVVTSKNRKYAHMYNGPIVLLANFFILKYLWGIWIALLLIAIYGLICFYLAKESTQKKRSPKRFGKYFLWHLSKIGLLLYGLLVVIGTILEALK